VRAFLEDHLETGVDRGFRQGYLLGRRAGLVQALSGGEASVPVLTSIEREAIVCSVFSESLKSVVIRDPRPEKPKPVLTPEEIADGR